jgi:flagellar biosynthesis protein FlhG
MTATPRRRPDAPDLPAAPRDQAHGLRQLFAANELRFVPLVHNPSVAGTGVVMERLCAAFTAQGLRTLVVDAAETASHPHQLASVDLAACVEPLSPWVSYLAARGLPMDYLDGRATLSAFLEALRSAAPQADVVLLHASALDLRRMFIGRTPRPVLLASARPDSLTHAYTSMKLLSQRLGALAYGLVVAGDVTPGRARGMADRLESCGDHFLGAALRDLAVVDPLAPPHAALPDDLRTLAAGLVAPPATAAPANPLAELPSPLSARVSTRRPAAAGHMN